MDPYAKPKECKIGEKRPKAAHLSRAIDTRTRSERKAEKQAVVDEHLKREMLDELNG